MRWLRCKSGGLFFFLLLKHYSFIIVLWNGKFLLPEVIFYFNRRNHTTDHPFLPGRRAY